MPETKDQAELKFPEKHTEVHEGAEKLNIIVR
jgi:hypothetical protein